MLTGQADRQLTVTECGGWLQHSSHPVGWQLHCLWLVLQTICQATATPLDGAACHTAMLDYDVSTVSHLSQALEFQTSLAHGMRGTQKET